MKLSSISMFKPAFTGYEYRKNSFGETCYYFNFPHDSGNVDEKEQAKKEGKTYNGYCQHCKLEIYRLNEDNQTLDTTKHCVIENIPEEGITLDLINDYGFDSKDKIAYRFEIIDSNNNVTKAHDVGANKYLNGENYSIASLSAFKPTVNGSGYLLMPDSFAPGYVFNGFTEKNADDIGKVTLNKDKRAAAEKAKRTFSNSYGGGLAGMIAQIPYLKERGIKIVFGTPITGGDNVSAFKYWPENLFQLAGGIGEINNYEDYMAELFKNGMVFVMDAPLTSEGMAGIHYQYALSWGDRDNQMRHWFRMNGIDSNQVGYGIVGKNSKGLRHYIVNAPNKFIEKDGQIHYNEPNEDYDPKKPTYIQYYDVDYVSEEAVRKRRLLERFDKLTAENPLQTGTHDDTVINFSHILDKADYNAYLKNIDNLNEINKAGKNKIDAQSKEGTIYLSNLTSTKLTEKKAAGVLYWDANTDMIKLRYFDSSYDYTSKYSEPVDSAGLTAANNETQDMSIRYAKYWTQKTKDIQNIYTAKMLGDIAGAEFGKVRIDQLIKDGKLPKEAAMDLEALEMIDLNLYKLGLPEIMADTLIDKLAMELPLESLELSKDTLGVLSTSYFTARATRIEQQGRSRYELAQEGNPQFTEELNERYGYKKVYEKVNEMFTGEVHDFVRAVLESVDSEMPEDKKIFEKGSNNKLTEYGYYVAKFTVQDIAKHILLKAFVPESDAKVNTKGQILYDYTKLREESSLPQLGVRAHTPEYQAELLAKRMKHGLKEFSSDSEQIKLVKTAVLNRFKDVNLNAFRYAEAIVDKSGLSLRHRVDALKDIEDIDACVNQTEDPAKVQKNLIAFWRRFKDAIYGVSSDSVIYDEITDTEKIKIDKHDNPVVKFMNESEHTTEAAYSYTFTDFLKIFAGEAAKETLNMGYTGGASYYIDDINDPNPKPFPTSQIAIDNQLRGLFGIQMPLEYIRSLYTFGGNHDKPRLNYCMMVDQKLVHADIYNLPDVGVTPEAHNDQRVTALLMTTGALGLYDLPYDMLYHMSDRDYINTYYLMGTSTAAIANGKIIRDNLNEVLSGKLTEAEISKLHEAVTSLVNGEFTLEPEKRASFTDYKTAAEEIISIAEEHNLGLRRDEKYDVRPELIKKIADKAKAKARDITLAGTKSPQYNNLHNYHPYYENIPGVPNQILVLGNLLRNAAEEGLNELENHYKGEDNPYANKAEILEKIDSSIREYIRKYKEADVLEDLNRHSNYLMARSDNERDAFGGTDIREAIRLVFTKAGLEGKTNAQFELFKALNEPAAAKVRMYMRALASFPGVPTLYGGDEFSLGGRERKSKNIDLQNRNATPFSKLESDDSEAEYYKKMNEDFKQISNLRKSDGVLSPLNTGTPYYISPQVGKNLSNPSISKTILPALFTMDAEGSSVLSLFNFAGITPFPGTYVQQPDTVELDQITLSSDYNGFRPMGIAGISVTAGLIFKNIVEGDSTIYKVVKDNFNYYIKRFDAAGKNLKIILDKGTMLDGVFTLYNKVHFKGGRHREYYNPQYNIVSNPYHYLKENNRCGEKLSLVSK